MGIVKSCMPFVNNEMGEPMPSDVEAALLDFATKCDKQALHFRRLAGDHDNREFEIPMDLHKRIVLSARAEAWKAAKQLALRYAERNADVDVSGLQADVG